MLTEAEIAELRAELDEAGVDAPVYDFIPLSAATPPRMLLPEPPIVVRGGWTDWWRPRER